jgi:hypothetical protein
MNLLVTVSFTLHLPEDVYPVIVTQGSGHLVVIHGQVVLLYAPQFGKTRGIDNLENSHFLVFPRYEAGETLMGVV